MKKVAILAAPGFEEIELIAPLDILRRLNMEVMLAGVQSDKVVSAHDVTVTTDTMLDKLHADKLDALVLPGGAASKRQKAKSHFPRDRKASIFPTIANHFRHLARSKAHSASLNCGKG